MSAKLTEKTPAGECVCTRNTVLNVSLNVFFSCGGEGGGDRGYMCFCVDGSVLGRSALTQLRFAYSRTLQDLS